MTDTKKETVNAIQSDSGAWLLDILKEVVLNETVKTESGFKII